LKIVSKNWTNYLYRLNARTVTYILHSNYLDQ